VAPLGGCRPPFFYGVIAYLLLTRRIKENEMKIRCTPLELCVAFGNLHPLVLALCCKQCLNEVDGLQEYEEQWGMCRKCYLNALDKNLITKEEIREIEG
jgi:hypothetical protein